MILLRNAWKWLDSNLTGARSLNAPLYGFAYTLVIGAMISMFILKGQAEPYSKGMALASALIWPMAVRTCFIPSVRRGPRRADILANLALCVPAVAAATHLWGGVDILPLCGVGIGLALASHGLQQVEFSWGLPISGVGPAKEGTAPEKLAFSAGNILKTTAHAALSLFDDGFIVVLMIVLNIAPKDRPPNPAAVFTAEMCRNLLFLALLLFIIRLGKNLRNFIRIKYRFAVSLCYGLLAFACAWMLFRSIGWDDPWFAPVVGVAFGGILWLSLDKAEKDAEP